MFFTIILAASVLILAAVLLYARWNYGVLESLGIPVVKPTLFTGSIPDLHKKVQTEEDIESFKKYGSVWGYYEGRTPIINVCDPNIIREIFLKDVSSFYDRRVGHFGDPKIDEILDYLPGEKWKKMRKLQTVLFSSGKIRQYSKQLAEAANDFVCNLSQKCDERGRVKVNARSEMDVISLDGISRVAFGMKLENVDDPNNHFYQGLKTLLGEGSEYNWLYSLSMVFPILHKIAPSFQIQPILFDTFRNLIEQRRTSTPSSTASPDLADFLAKCYDQLDSDEFKKLGITETTLLAQALNVTSLDMVSATMTMLSYYLATHPEVQEKIHAELDSLLEGKIDSETVKELPYLSATVSETLRLAPPLIRLERVCNKDWISSCGTVRIKKGVVVIAPLWAIHRQEEFFPEPETFNPERFLTKENKHQYAYVPFGLGLRNCIGMRLAIETLKINVATILKTFKIEVRKDTRLELKPGMLYLLQFRPLYLNFIRRGKVMSVSCEEENDVRSI